MIAERFVRSHAPVSAHDLARWADLTVTDARAGLAAAAGVVPRTIDGRDLFVTEALLDAGTARPRHRPGAAARPRPARVRRAGPRLPRPHRPARCRPREAGRPRRQRGVREHARRGRSRCRHLEAPGAGTHRRHPRHPLRPDHRTRPPAPRGVPRRVREVRRQAQPHQLVRRSSPSAAHLSRDHINTNLVLIHNHLHGHDDLNLRRGYHINSAEVDLKLRDHRVHLILNLLIIKSLNNR